MLGKLLYGQLSLKESFWKFGLLGVFVCALITKIIKSFLLQQINGISLFVYYTHYFSPLKLNGPVLFLTLLYFLSAFILCAYSLIVLLGVWKSAGEYNKSIWLRHIARLFIILIVYFGLRFGL